jgi:transcriptional regulator of acetoin/glycerol metabolism
MTDLPEQVAESRAADVDRVDLSRKQQARRQRVLEALRQTRGNRAAAARQLEVSRGTLYRWIDELKITDDEIEP